MKSLNEWKDNYLNEVGVPHNFPTDWDFISCVTACKSFIIFLSPFLRHILRLYVSKSRLRLTACYLTGGEYDLSNIDLALSSFRRK